MKLICILQESKFKNTKYEISKPHCGDKPPKHNYDILGARMLWKPKEARILKNFIEF
jgi:hypothetical protein